MALELELKWTETLRSAGARIRGGANTDAVSVRPCFHGYTHTHTHRCRALGADPDRTLSFQCCYSEASGLEPTVLGCEHVSFVL